MRIFRKPRSLFGKMFFFFTVAFVILLSLLSSTLYYYFEKMNVNMVTETNEDILNQISYSADYMHDSAKNFAFSIYENSNVTQLMYQDSMDFNDSFQMNKIKESVQINSFVHSVYIYNGKLNVFYTTLYSGSAESHSFIDQGMVAILSHIDQYDKFKPIARKVPLDVNAPDKKNPSIDVYSYLVYDFANKGHLPDGAVIVNVRSEYLNQIIDSLNGKKTFAKGDTFVFDRDGVMVSGLGGKILHHDIPSNMAVNKVLSSNTASGYFVDHSDHKKFLVTYASSKVLGWKFINVVPYNEALSRIHYFKGLTLGICLALLFMGFIISFVISRQIYFPFRSLIGKVSHSMDSKDSNLKDMDEIALLSQAFIDSFHKGSQLDAVNRDIYLTRKNEVLRNMLLTENPNPDHFTQVFQKYNVSLDSHNHYLLCLLSIDHYGDFIGKYSTTDQALLRYAIMNVCKELMSREYICEGVDLGEDRVVLILTVDDPSYPDPYHKLSNIIVEIQQWISVNMNLSLSAAISFVGKQYSKLHYAYGEACNIANYRLTFGHGSILQPESLKKVNMEHYKISAAVEKQFMDALVYGKLEEAEQTYKEISSELILHSYHTIQSTFFYLMYCIYNTLNLMEDHSFHKFSIDYKLSTREVSQLETIDEINQWFIGLLTQITKIVNERKNKRGSLVTDLIVNLIKANYKDKSLCLESIADMVNMSKMYVGRLFRESYGISVADYITNVRMNKAVELIDEGGKHLNDIIDEVGINNRNYFYKVFKVRMGVTLSEYKLKKQTEGAKEA